MAIISEAASNDSPSAIVALMMGEIRFQPTINQISLSIVQHAARLWQANPEAVVICESEPMRTAAEALGVPAAKVITALPQESGHTTRLVAEWLREHRDALPQGRWVICTHTLHSDRACRILRKAGVSGVASEVDAPFDPQDQDWKLRSAIAFQLYNAIAEIYCRLRGWV